MTIECAQCGAEATDGTKECPECGYRPYKKMQLVGAIIFGLGLIASIALIGIPIALYGLYRFFRAKFVTIESDYGL